MRAASLAFLLPTIACAGAAPAAPAPDLAAPPPEPIAAAQPGHPPSSALVDAVSPPDGVPSSWIVDRYGEGYSTDSWIDAGRPGLDAGVHCFSWSPTGDREVTCP
jgi:hypothetical protein